MPRWVDIGQASDFPDNCQTSVTADRVPLVVFKIDGEYRSIVNICPHAGMPLGEGELSGTVLTCPFHGYSYDVCTGKNVDFPDFEEPLATFPMRTTDEGRLEVDLESIPQR